MEESLVSGFPKIGGCFLWTSKVSQQKTCLPSHHFYFMIPWTKHETYSGQIVCNSSPILISLKQGDFPSSATFWGEVVGRYNLTRILETNWFPQDCHWYFWNTRVLHVFVFTNVTMKRIIPRNCWLEITTHSLQRLTKKLPPRVRIQNHQSATTLTTGCTKIMHFFWEKKQNKILGRLGPPIFFSQLPSYKVGPGSRKNIGLLS